MAQNTTSTSQNETSHHQAVAHDVDVSMPAPSAVSLPPPPLQLKSGSQKGTAFQRKENPIQRDEDDQENGVDFSLMPPSFQARYGLFNTDINTSRAQMGFNLGQSDRNLNLGYNYGSDIYAGLNFDGWDSRLGFNPGSRDFSAALTHGQFNARGAVNPWARSGSLSVGYGAPMMPWAWDVQEGMQAGGNSLTNMVGNTPAMLNDPMAFMGAHSEDMGNVGTAAGLMSRLMAERRQRWGIGGNLSYSPDNGLNAMLTGGLYF